MKTIYVYYGNPSATSASNGDETFLFFDDFNDQYVDTNKWQDWDGSATELPDGTLKLVGNSRLDIHFYSKTWITNPYIVETRYLRGYDGGLFFDVVDSYNGYLISLRDATMGLPKFEFYKWINGSWYTLTKSNPGVDTDWHKFKLVRNGSSMQIFEDGVLKLTASDGTYSGGYIGIRGWGDHPTYTDWIFVRKYTDPEPIVSVGQETPSQPQPIPEFPAVVIPALVAIGILALKKRHNN